MSKNVFITGVLGGIGAGLSHAFRKNGYYVYGVDKEEDFDNVCDRFLRFDLNQFVTDVEYRIRFTQIFDDIMPTLDVLINNAAVQRLDHLEDLKLEDWQETLNVNLTGPLMLSKLFLERLEKRKGSIINIGSIHQRQTKRAFISYATSKSALIGLTKSLAVDLEGRVRVNAISPAAIETDMLRAGFENDEKALDELRKIHPVQRIGLPEDVAKLALFLAAENEGFIHGANFQLDGGIGSVLKDL
ncbi:MAG TPA: SDR family oxidoreductase [Bacteroidetes bacterium]|nr:SDR family oxidoreductase [Bacteroidota bacterium]